jgi:poly(3-hydroxybutyrate) depolymerase
LGLAGRSGHDHRSSHPHEPRAPRPRRRHRHDPQRDPALPLVISPHGRGVTGDGNARLWGALPALGDFAVVNPAGSGRRLSGRFAWGAPGDIDDLARMSRLVERAPGVRIDRHHVYAVGGSMGAQETLLPVARHPTLLAGAVAVDAATDFGRQYRRTLRRPGGRRSAARRRLRAPPSPGAARPRTRPRSPLRASRFRSGEPHRPRDPAVAAPVGPSRRRAPPLPSAAPG